MRISQKGLLLVSIPLLFQIAFILILGQELHQAESKIEQQIQAKDVLASLDSGQRHWTYAFCYTILFVISEKPEYRQAQAQYASKLRQEFEQLKAVPLPNQPKDFVPNTIKLLERSLALEKFLMTPTGRRYGQRFYQETRQGIRYIRWPMDVVVQALKKQETEGPEQRKIVTQRIQQTIAIGLVTSIIITIGLAIYFDRGIMRRLKNVLENIERLKREHPPKKPAPGKDEIAELDHVLFDAASEIITLEKFKEQTIGIAKRELKTPLNLITQTFEQLEKNSTTILSKPALDIIQVGHKNSKRLLELINDLLDLDRIETGKLELKCGTIQSEELAKLSFDAVKEFAAKHGIHLVLQLETDYIYGDMDRLTQVIINLLSNAIKFSPEQGTVIFRASDGPQCFELSVIDSGRGIPTAYIDKIFDRFQQVEKTDTTKKGGTGLGLSICKSIVEQHGGIIGVESSVGNGARFWIKLPHQNSPAILSNKIEQDDQQPINKEEKFQLKLSHKGFLVILMPLVSTIVLSISISSLIQQASMEVETRFKNKEVFATLGMLSTKIADGYIISVLESQKHASQRLLRQQDNNLQAKELLKTFGQLANSPLQKQHYLELKSMLSTLLALQKETASDQEEDFSGLRNEFQHLESIMEQEKALLQDDPTKASHIRANINNTLIALLVINVFFALASVLIFSQNIVKRIHHIAENARLLANKLPLKLPIQGSDELSLIDRSLFAAANHLAELQQYKKQLIGIVSHELNTPLTSIKGSIGLLCAGAHGDLTTETKTVLETANAESARLVRLIRDLLDIELVESGHFELQLAKEKVESLFNEVLSLIKAEAEIKGVAIKSMPAPNNINCDKKRLCQALTNLLSNAISFAQSGQSLSLTATEQGSALEIRIKGFVSKISDETKKSMFEQFPETKEQDAKQAPDYFLGLFMAKKIIEQHKGQIGLETSAEAGSSFWLTLPVA